MPSVVLICRIDGKGMVRLESRDQGCNDGSGWPRVTQIECGMVEDVIRSRSRQIGAKRWISRCDVGCGCNPADV